MNEQNDKQKQEAGACGPACGCGTTVSGRRWRWIAGIVILLVAGALVVRAMVKDKGDLTSNAISARFAALPAVAAAPDKTPVVKPATATDGLKELDSLSDLNSAADDTFGVFVFLPGKGETAAKAPIAQMRSAAQTIEPQLNGGKIGMFALKAESRDYEQIAMQMAVPGVLAMVKGGGMSAASGDITETKLAQALVAASRSDGCGTGGCGPVGCD